MTNSLWHIVQSARNSGWGSWATLGGVLADGVTAVQNLFGRAVAFVEGTDQSLWYIQQTAPGSWN